VELRVIQGFVGLVVVGALVLFTVFPSIKPDWIQLGSGRGRGARAAQAFFNRTSFSDEEFEAEDCLDRGATYLLAERYDRAVQEFSQAIKLQPQDSEGYYFRGVSYQALSKHAEALSDFATAIRLAPDDADAHLSRAEVLAEMGRNQEALADLEKVLKLAPDNAEAVGFRGELREEAGDYRGALADYKAALKELSDDPWLLNNLAWVLATAPDKSLRNGPESVKHAMKAVELDGGKEWDTLDTLAAACAEVGKFPEAERCQKEAIAFAPADARPELEQRLALYRARQPFRLPAAETAHQESK
jgi:tetratricopeptide (TPR) repeat protein